MVYIYRQKSLERRSVRWILDLLNVYNLTYTNAMMLMLLLNYHPDLWHLVLLTFSWGFFVFLAKKEGRQEGSRRSLGGEKSWA